MKTLYLSLLLILASNTWAQEQRPEPSMVLRVVSYSLGDVVLDAIPPEDSVHCDRLDFIILSPETFVGREWHFLIQKGSYGPILDYGHRKGDILTVALKDLHLSESEIAEKIKRGEVFDTVILPDAVLKRPNQALLPTPTSVTPPAAQEPRQP